MNDKARGILEAAGAKADPIASGEIANLAERMRPEWVVRGVTPFRKFLGIPADIGKSRPAEEFFEVFLGSGREGAVALLDAYAETLPDAENEDRLSEFAALAAVAQAAQSMGIIGWDLRSWKPAARDPGRRRLTAFLPVELAERVRVTAFESRISMSDFVQRAIMRELAELEQKRGKPIKIRARRAHREKTPAEAAAV